MMKAFWQANMNKRAVQIKKEHDSHRHTGTEAHTQKTKNGAHCMRRRIETESNYNPSRNRAF